MKTFLQLVVLVTLTISSFESVFADAAAGKAKSGICMACHGVSGISNNDMWPNLAGQKRGYLVKQIKAFRDGGRVDIMMAPMVKALSDEDIENLAAYYSEL
ncbi:MAG: cytochrome c553 [Flavobacterium sp.]|jgi:cytochrome c553